MRKIKNGLYRNVGLKSGGSSATWHFQFTFRGKQYSGDTKHTSRGAAKAWLDAYKFNLSNKGVGLIPTALMPDLQHALDDWCKAKNGQVVASHIKDVETAITLHCKDYLGYLISEITTPVVERIRTTYLSTVGNGYHGAKLHHTEGGANTVVKHLRSVIGSYISKSMYDDLPLKEMPFKIEDLEAQESLKGVLWPEQVLQFLQHGKRSRHPHAYTAICLMLCLGLREDETLNARWEAVSWRNHTYSVACDRARKITTKSRKSREIAIPDWLEQHLRNLWETAGKPLMGLILPNKKDKKHVAGYTAKPIARCARKMEIQNLHPHSLRGSFATGHFEIGTPLGQIQLMLGHASSDTTLLYISQRPFEQAKAQELLAARMGLNASGAHFELEYQI